MLSREDRILSELLVSRGLISRERIESCAKSRQASTAHLSLAEALVDSGELARDEAQQAADEARALDEALTPELPAGHVLGEFRLIREIGRGGMGIVYEAEQESLGRRVALKVLPAGAALDERLSLRFLREARAVGRLRHPGIVPVYTSGRAGGVLYYAMELIEGRSLADALAGGPLAPVEAARIAAEVARALDYAHGQGLVHRDIKPENILLCSDGRTRIVDFGLVHDLAAGSFTLSRHVLGTPAYTAPEQARGEPVGPRSDVYGLGAVMYSMLAGVPPYREDTPSVVLARLLTEGPPPLSQAAREIPRALAAIAERAMARDPEQRYPTAAALADALERFLQPGSSTEQPGPPGASVRVRWVGAVAGAALLVVLALMLVGRHAEPAAAIPATQRAAELKLALATPGHKASPSLSPDGKQLAYASDADGDWDIHLLDLASGATVNLTAESAVEDLDPAFSPDGQAIAFMHVFEIHVIELEARRPRKISDRKASNLAWSADGRAILFADQAYNRPGSSSSGGKLWAVDVATGKESPLTGMYAVQPAASSATRRIAFVSQDGGRTDLWTIPDGGGAAVRLTDDDAIEWSPVWIMDGREIVFGSDRDGGGGLWKISVDPVTGAAVGVPVRLSAAVLPAPFYLTAGTARGSPLILATLERGATLHRLTADGEQWSLDGIASLAGRYIAVECADPSPDGQRIAFTAVGPEEDLAVSGADGSAPRLLVRDAFRDRVPRWSPAGSLIAFQSNRSGNMEIWTIRPDGSALARRTWTDGDAALPVWSPDGKRIAYSKTGTGAYTLSLGAAGAAAADPEMLPAVEGGHPFEPCSWSRDGRWLAGSAGGIVIYSLANKQYRRLTDSGVRPVWLDDGRRLLFVDGREIRMLDSRTGASHAIFSAAPAGLSSCLSASADGRSIYAGLTGSAEELWQFEIGD